MSDRPTRPRSRLAAAWLAGLWLLAVAVLSAPHPGLPLRVSLDHAWQEALTVAFRERLEWGTQVVWTFGPYGYMNSLWFTDFDSWLPALAVNLAGHAAFFAVLALFIAQSGGRAWQWLLAGALLLLPLYSFTSLQYESVVTVMLLLHLSVDSAGERRGVPLAGMAGLLSSFLLLLKGNAVVVIAGLALVFVVLSLFWGHRSSAAAFLVSGVVGFLGLRLLAGQSPLAIPGYFASLYEIAIGYTPAMSAYWETGVGHLGLQLAVAAAMVGLTGLSALLALWQRDRPLSGLLLLSLPLLLVTFKEGFVRFGELHALIFWSVAVVILGLIVVRALAPGARAPRAWPALPVGVSMLASALLISGVANSIGGTPELKPTWPLLAFPEKVSAYRHAWTLVLDPSSRREQEAQVQEAVRAYYALTPGLVEQLRSGDVDTVPWDTQLIFAYGLDWNPRPVLQSYAAYRPGLDHRDAEHFRSAAAPRFVLFFWEDVDGRYPLFSEPETYRVLFQRYHVRERTPHFLLLERRAQTPPAQITELGTAIAPLGHWIEVPVASDPIYARVEVRYTPIGHALNLAWQPPQLHVRFRYAGGQVSRPYRFVPAVAPDGLPVSGYAVDTGDLERMASGRFDHPIEAIQVTADNPQQAYEKQVGVAYFTVASHAALDDAITGGTTSATGRP